MPTPKKPNSKTVAKEVPAYKKKHCGKSDCKTAVDLEAPADVYKRQSLNMCSTSLEVVESRFPVGSSASRMLGLHRPANNA